MKVLVEFEVSAKTQEQARETIVGTIGASCLPRECWRFADGGKMTLKQGVIVFKSNSIDVAIFDDLESAKVFALEIVKNTGDEYFIFGNCVEVGKVARKAMFTPRIFTKEDYYR